jgi:hypothetical protein
MTEPVISTAAGAFMVGLLTSAHCALMCGPWLCAALPKPSPAYHVGRTMAYTALGTTAGALGKQPLQALLGPHSPAALLPWVLALLLASILIGWKPSLPKPRALQRLSLRLGGNLRPHKISARGFLTGILTPLLPCAPLYLVLAACLVSGSALAGAQFAMAFTLGTIPLLWLSQSGWGRLSRRLSPARMRTLQRSMAALALVMVLARLLPAGASPASQKADSTTADAAPSCPLCSLPGIAAGNAASAPAADSSQPAPAP